jgi:hypothetical protein
MFNSLTKTDTESVYSVILVLYNYRERVAITLRLIDTCLRPVMYVFPQYVSPLMK